MAGQPLSFGARLKGSIARFVAHDDPLVAAGNLLALIVASNQPFYPLYVGLIAGGAAAWRSAVVLAAMPFFLAVPMVARRAPVIGRMLLPLTGIANTLVCIHVLGPEAGLDMLLVPCAAIAALLFRARERAAMLCVVGVAVVAWLLADNTALGLFNAEAYAGLRRLNAVSAIALCGLLGWVAPRRE